MKNKTTMRYPYLISAKKARGCKVFEFVQFYTDRTTALGANIEGLFVTDAQRLTEADADLRGVPHSVEVD